MSELPSPPNGLPPDVEWVRIEACPDWNAYPTGYLHRKSCQLCQGEGFITVGDPVPEGRLVDRNAINYGAVERVIREWNSYTPEAVTRFVSELVAAMFGGSDEK